MAIYPSLTFMIGEQDWIRSVRDFAETISKNYWANFVLIDKPEIDECEKTLNRRLPEDFRLFWLTFGAGEFPEECGGNIYRPSEVIEACAGPMWMILGSSNWATDQDHFQLYRTRGKFNPAPDKFSSAALTHNGVSLFDLLQIGTDGSCRYHQLHVGEGDKPFGYCLLTPEGTFENIEPSFSMGLRSMLITHWKSVHVDE